MCPHVYSDDWVFAGHVQVEPDVRVVSRLSVNDNNCLGFTEARDDEVLFGLVLLAANSRLMNNNLFPYRMRVTCGSRLAVT